MPSRELQMDDLATPIGARRTCIPRRCLSPSPRRCVDSSLCSPCPTRCYSSSPSARRRRAARRCSVPQRDLKSGRMVCDKFTSVCYPRNLGNYCSNYGGGCSPRYRNAVSYRSCTPTRCPRGICRVSCRCPPPSPPPYCPPCSPCGDVCEPDPSDRFVQAMKSTGPCTSRYQTHLCPWEADVTVSGTIRAHCTSTADEISNRLAGPFKAFGKRFTTDTENNWSSCEPCYDQKLSLGMLDDGGCLDFSRNNRPTSENPTLDYRVKRIMNRSQISSRDRKTPSKPLPSRDNHITWDTSMDYNDSRDSRTRLSRMYDNYSDRGRRINYSDYEDEGNFRRRPSEDRTFEDRRRSSDDRPFDHRTRGNEYRPDEGLSYGRHRDEPFLDGGRRLGNESRYNSGDRRGQGDKRSSFEIMMNQRSQTNNKSRFNYPSKLGRYSKPFSDSEFEDGYNDIKMGGKRYESGSGCDADAEDNFSSRYRSKQRTTDIGVLDRSRNHYSYPDRRDEEDRRRHSYEHDFNISKLNNSYSSSGPDTSNRNRLQKDSEDLERIRFWPYGGDRD